MTAITAANVTWTRISDHPPDVGIRNRRYIKGTLAFGNASLTYPSGGIPLPGPANDVGGMSLARSISALRILDVTYGKAQGATPPMFMWDSVNKTIRMFHPGGAGGVDSTDSTEYATTDAPAATTLLVEVEGI